MSWPFRDEHEELRVALARFVDAELRPHLDEWDDAGYFPDDVFLRLGELGYLGLLIPGEYGGSGPDLLAQAVVIEELGAAGCGGLAAGVGAHTNIATPPVLRFGTEAQKQRYLPDAVAGRRVGALAITEPDAGSDVAGIRTAARKADGGFVLQGTKLFITNGVRAGFVVVVARTSPAERRHHGLSLFVVDAGTPGFSASRSLKKLGWRASDTAELVFDDCFVPEDALLGEEGRGFYHVMANFQQERLAIALTAVGEARFALSEAARFATQRKAFGTTIGSFQAIRHLIADCATELEAARSLTYRALAMMAEGVDAITEVTMAKLFATEVSHRIADRCLQVHGGYGYTREFPIERVFRDSRLGPIGGGTSQIMRDIIGQAILRRAEAT
ncbi:MAG: acyl-CoA dehydrogenase family protein [Actinomycetota bacterium]